MSNEQLSQLEIESAVIKCIQEYVYPNDTEELYNSVANISDIISRLLLIMFEKNLINIKDIEFVIDNKIKGGKSS